MGAFNQLLAGAASAVNPAEAGRKDPVDAAQRAGIFLALNASTVELSDLGGWVGGWVGGGQGGWAVRCWFRADSGNAGGGFGDVLGGCWVLRAQRCITRCVFLHCRIAVWPVWLQRRT